jgi:hypothetical protein
MSESVVASSQQNHAGPCAYSHAAGSFLTGFICTLTIGVATVLLGRGMSRMSNHQAAERSSKAGSDDFNHR